MGLRSDNNIQDIKIGNIVLLNGTSSAGKSAILEEFTKLEKDYIIFKIDDWFPSQIIKKAKELGWEENSGIDPWIFLHVYATKTTGNYYFDTELREKLFDSFGNFYQQIKELVQKENNVIIDIVLEHEKAYTEFFNFFNSFNVVKVLVYCPLDILVKRVAMRNKYGKLEERRMNFLSFEQFPAIYKIGQSGNAQIVDIAKSSEIKKALVDSIQDLIDNKIPDIYIPKLREFERKFIEQFNLNKQEEIALVPTHNYDLILNSSTNTPQELAAQITNYLKHC